MEIEIFECFFPDKFLSCADHYQAVANKSKNKTSRFNILAHKEVQSKTKFNSFFQIKCHVEGKKLLQKNLK